MAGPGGEGRRRRSRRRGPFASSEAESATTPHARTQPASGRSGRQTGRAALGSRRLQLLGGGFSEEAWPSPLSRFRGGDGDSCPLALPPASPAAGKKLGRALLQRYRRRRAGRAVGAGPGRAASDTSPWRPLPRQRRPPSPRPLPLGSGRVPVASSRPNPVQRSRPSAPRGVDPGPSPSGVLAAAPLRDVSPSPPGRRAGPRAPKLGKESWRWGGVAHSWRRKGLSFGKRPDDVARLESGLERVGGTGGRRRRPAGGEEGGIEWGPAG